VRREGKGMEWKKGEREREMEMKEKGMNERKRAGIRK
jgi:hypothetical protein